MKYIKMTVCLLMAMLAAVMFSSEAKAAEENIASGVIDEGYGQITWVIDSEGKLTVTGTGDVSDSSDSERIPWYVYTDEITSAEIDVTGMTDASYLLSDCSNMISVDLSEFDTTNVTTMRSMFDSCKSLTSLDVSGFDTDNVTDMRWMFYKCSGLTSLDISRFDTSKVTDMGYMFRGCSGLTALDVSGWNTANVQIIASLFAECSGLTSLDVTGFDTTSVTDMNCMFYKCSGLTTLNIKGFDTSNVTNMSNLFYKCSALRYLDLGSWDMTKVTNVTNILYGCTGLEWINGPVNLAKTVTLPVQEQTDQWYKTDGTVITELQQGQAEGMIFVKNELPIASGVIDEKYGQIAWIIDSEGKLTVTGMGNFKENMNYNSNPWYSQRESILSAEITVVEMTNASGLFADCTALKSIDMCNFDTSSVTDMSGMFRGCNSLEELDVSNFDTSNVTDMGSMFSDCSSLIKLDVSNFDTSNVTDMSWMFCMFFNGHGALTKLDVSGFDTSNVTDMKSMFAYCNKLTELDVSGFDTGNVTSMRAMFENCNALTEIDVGDFKTGNVTDMTYMFMNCSSVLELDVSGFDTSNVTGMQGMFYECSVLKGLDVSGFNTSKVTDMAAMFSDCSSLKELDVSGFDTSNVTDMSAMFQSCGQLSELNVRELNTSNVTDMSNMFSSCSKLTELDISGFDTSSVDDMRWMFSNCTSLKTLNMSGVDLANVTNVENMFYECIILERIETPINCLQLIELPPARTKVNTWYQPDGTVIEALPQGLAESITITRDCAGIITKAPTVSLVKEDGVVSGIALTNNEETYSTIWYGLATKEEIDAGIYLDSGVGLAGLDTTTETIEWIVEGDSLEQGEYYFVACASNGDKERSKTVVLEDYPFVITEITCEESIVYQTGDVTGYRYFIGKSADEYDYAQAELWVTDEGGSSWTSVWSLNTKNGIFYLDVENYNEHYGEWIIEQLSFEKINVTGESCNVTKSVYTKTEAEGTYEEIRTEAPTITLKEDGGVNGIEIRNNDEIASYISCELVTREELEEGVEFVDGYYRYYLGYLETTTQSLKDLVAEEMQEQGEYYLVVHAFNPEKEISETVVLENYPIVITETIYEESIVYQTGNVTGYKYLMGKENDKYDYAHLTLQVTDEWENSWVENYNLNSKRGLFYFNDEDYSYGDREWIISKVTFGKMDITDTKCNVEHSIITSVEEGGTFDEKSGVIDKEYGQIVWQIDDEGKLTVTGTGDVSASEGYNRMPWYEYREDILTAEVNVAGMTDASNLFRDCSNMTSIDLSNFDTSQVTNMNNMFAYCSNLTELDLSGCDTNQVTDMSSMFEGCEKIVQVDLSNFDTSQVTDMSKMFAHCRSLTELNVSNFNTVSVTSMASMFMWCKNLQKVDVSSFETSNVKSFYFMFYGCNSLGEVDASGFNTSNAASMSGMFSGCSSLEELDVSGFNTGNVTSMREMFWNCSNLTELDVTNFDTSKVKDMSYMFKRCEKLTSLDISGFDMSNVTEAEEMLLRCKSLLEIKTPKNCSKVVALPSETWYLSEGKSIEMLPRNVSYSMTITRNRVPDNENVIPDDDDSGILGSGIIADDYGNITWKIDNQGKLSIQGTGNVNVSDDDCTIPWESYRTDFVLAEIDVKNMTNASFLFYDCTSLRRIDDSKFDTSNITNMYMMFGDCGQLLEMNLSHWDTGNVTKMNDMFFGCESLESIDMSDCDTSNVTNMAGMFGSCDSLKNVNLNGVDTSNVTHMGSMFWYCEALESIDLSDFDMSNVTNAEDMFTKCNNLEQIEAPRNCSIEIDLPTSSEDDKWYLPDGTVITTLPLGLTESITITKNQIPTVSTPVTEVFSDVSEGKWYVDCIQYVYDNGIMSGNNGAFNPTGSITRAQVVSTLYKLAGSPTVTDYSACDELVDVERNAWYTDAVCWAYNTGVGTGNSTTKMFNVNSPVTRQQLASFFYRYAEYKDFDTSATADISTMLNADQVSVYAEEAVKWAVGVGIISGSQTTDAAGNTVYDLKPVGTATRAQMAAILQRFCENYNI